MSTQDKLPPLPEPFCDDYYWLAEDGPHEAPLWSAEQMHEYARAALAAAQQAEPDTAGLAWALHVAGREHGCSVHMRWDSEAQAKAFVQWCQTRIGTVYASPPAREERQAVALTEEQIADLWNEHMVWGQSDRGKLPDFTAAIRAAERAVWQANNLREPT